MDILQNNPNWSRMCVGGGVNTFLLITFSNTTVTYSADKRAPSYPGGTHRNCQKGFDPPFKVIANIVNDYLSQRAQNAIHPHYSFSTMNLTSIHATE